MRENEPVTGATGSSVKNEGTPDATADTVTHAKAASVHPPKYYRGSAARVRRLKFWALTPAGIWILFALSLAAAFGVLACLATLAHG